VYSMLKLLVGSTPKSNLGIESPLEAFARKDPIIALNNSAYK
jgi:hypothetical protein